MLNLVIHPSQLPMPPKIIFVSKAVYEGAAEWDITLVEAQLAVSVEDGSLKHKYLCLIVNFANITN